MTYALREAEAIVEGEGKAAYAVVEAVFVEHLGGSCECGPADRCDLYGDRRWAALEAQSNAPLPQLIDLCSALDGWGDEADCGDTLADRLRWWWRERLAVVVERCEDAAVDAWVVDHPLPAALPPATLEWREGDPVLQRTRRHDGTYFVDVIGLTVENVDRWPVPDGFILVPTADLAVSLYGDGMESGDASRRLMRLVDEAGRDGVDDAE